MEFNRILKESTNQSINQLTLLSELFEANQSIKPIDRSTQSCNSLKPTNQSVDQSIDQLNQSIQSKSKSSYSLKSLCQINRGGDLREFVFANERHPESVRVFPWLRPAAGDSVPADCRE